MCTGSQWVEVESKWNPCVEQVTPRSAIWDGSGTSWQVVLGQYNSGSCEQLDPAVTLIDAGSAQGVMCCVFDFGGSSPLKMPATVDSSWGVSEIVADCDLETATGPSIREIVSSVGIVRGVLGVQYCDGTQQPLHKPIAAALTRRDTLRDVQPAVLRLSRAGSITRAATVVFYAEQAIPEDEREIICRLNEVSAVSVVRVSADAVMCDFSSDSLTPGKYSPSMSVNGADFSELSTVVTVLPPSSLRYVSGSGVSDPIRSNRDIEISFGLEASQSSSILACSLILGDPAAAAAPRVLATQFGTNEFQCKMEPDVLHNA